jgi:zinc and cadmium transporter
MKQSNMHELVAILASVTMVSLISFIGIIFIGLKESVLKRLLMSLIGFASGTLLGGAFFNLLPESIPELGETTFYYVVIGIVIFFALEKFLYWRHCHEKECPVHMFAYLNLIGDGIHNFIDGMIIAATYLVSFELGFTTTLAVVMHEIPQEIGDFAVLIYGGFSKGKALTYNFLSAITAILGAIAAYSLAGIINFGALLVPFAAGGFIYIAATDLIPELHKRNTAGNSLMQLFTILLGLALMAYLKMMIGG